MIFKATDFELEAANEIKSDKPILNEIIIDLENAFLSTIDLLIVSFNVPILKLIFFKIVKNRLVNRVKIINETNRDTKT